MKTLNFIILLITSLLFSCFQTTGKNNTFNSTDSVQVTDTVINFENYIINETPAGWTNYLTGKGEMCKWEIRNDNGNNVLAQISNETPEYRFNIIANDGLKYKDLEISVKFKGVEGRIDQGGGLVWRFRDANNYYVARANPLENNFRVYKVVNGNRKQLKSASMTINTGQWYIIKITMKGNNIQCYFDDKLKLETTDNTFREEGKTGLWTKSDAITYFDDFRVKNIK
ncbi:MAG: DUF1080 domain-containing protein [Chlorobi bacterium]|nr:DUF1080 domain-containing protein [Chlorobiota bacterium]